MATGSSEMSFGLIATTIFQVLENSEIALRQATSSITEDSGPLEIAKFQAMLEQFNILLSLDSALIKNLGDAIKSTIAKFN